MKTYPASSYWEVELASGKVLSERQLCGNGQDGMRPIDWTFDLISTGDIRSVTRISLCTPVGKYSLSICYPQRAFAFKRARATFSDPLQNTMLAQIIGRIEDPASGLCRVFIWDTQTKQLYADRVTSIYNFAAWRSGVMAPGRLSPAILGVD